MNKRFMQLLADIAPQPMEQQLQLLDAAFEDWRGEERQLDDVLVVGVQIT